MDTSHYEKMATFCSYSERCISDVTKALEKMEMTLDEMDEIISLLVKDRFLDESRYANAYVRDKFRFNKWGKQKMAYMLRQKGLKENDIQNAFDEISEEEYENVLTQILLAKKKSTKSNNPYDLQNKLFRFAAGRGFEPHFIGKTIKKVLEK